MANLEIVTTRGLPVPPPAMISDLPVQFHIQRQCYEIIEMFVPNDIIQIGTCAPMAFHTSWRFTGTEDSKRMNSRWNGAYIYQYDGRIGVLWVVMRRENVREGMCFE